MLVGLITDTHIGSRNDSQNFSNYFKRFYRDVFFPTLHKHNIEHIIHLGDLFERRKYVNFKSLSDSREFLFEPLRDFQVELIVGNHDTFYKSTNVVNSPDLLLGDYKNINVYSEPHDLELGGCKMALLPWICSGNHQHSMDYIKSTSATHLFGHLELMGFEMYAGHTNDHGFDPALFSRFEQAYSGHFHHRSHRGNITYLGSPYETTWSDYNDPRGFHLFDTETKELTFIENPYRMFNKIYYNDTATDVEEMLKVDYDELTGTYVRIVIQDKSNPYGFERLVDKIGKTNPIDLSFSDDSLDLSFDDDELLEDVEDTQSIIVQSIEQAANPRIQPQLKKFMLELYSEALSLSRI